MKDKSDLISSKRSYQTLGHSQRTLHSSLSHAESKSGLPGTSSKRNVAFDSKLDKDKNKKNTIQVGFYYNLNFLVLKFGYKK